jgi:RNA 3'-phosphate cyclase
MATLEIDGSFGEGGGQILRTATCFSIIQGQPIRVTKVRAGRKAPGLRPQHSATLKILGEICNASLEGAEVGSTEVTFAPGRVENRVLRFDLGTAASVTLVLQAVVPAVALSGASLDLELIGGTDVPWSPTSDYITSVLVPGFRLMGMRFNLHVERRGYYPRGGGRVRAKIEPCNEVLAVDLAKRSERPAASIQSRCGRLPRGVAERQAEAAKGILEGGKVVLGDIVVTEEDSLSPGSSITIAAAGQGCYIGADSIGAKGKRAEKVGSEAAAEFLDVFESGACVDAHLSDMMAPFLCLASSESRLLAPKVTEHLRTSLHVAEQFTGTKYAFGAENGAWLVSIGPRRTK